MPTVETLPVVGVSKRVFDKLMDYSCSLPTGTTIGKWWKCRVDYHDASKGWLLCCYGPHKTDPDKVTIHRRRLDWYPWTKDDAPTNAGDLPPLNQESSFR